jgi:hypothetical protein
MDPALLLSILERVSRMGLETIADMQNGKLTQEQLTERLNAMHDRLDDANALWEQAGKTPAAQASETRAAQASQDAGAAADAVTGQTASVGSPRATAARPAVSGQPRPGGRRPT